MTITDGAYTIVANSNYPETSMFLMYYTSCKGEAKLIQGRWVVTVTDYYNEETDTDCRVIGDFDTSDEAVDALFEARYISV